MSGKLINNALVMYDRETRSLWSQFLSIGVQGEFEGVRLKTLPVVLTTWGEWTDQYPETTALMKPNSSLWDPYLGYYGDNSQPGIIGEKVKDERFARKELVLGLGFDDGPKAFPHSELRSKRVVNDEVAGEKALIIFREDSATAIAFNRTLDGRDLTFELIELDEREWLRDRETDTLWIPFTGLAVDGPLAGSVLDRMHGANVFWFAWTDFYPETEVFGVS